MSSGIQCTDCGKFYWDFVQIIYHIFSPLLTGIFNEFSADGNAMTDILSDGLTDESNDVQTEGNFPRNWTYGKFHPVILMGIFTMKN